MKKQKPKVSASQKRRTRVQQQKLDSQQANHQLPRNWVEDRIDWIPLLEFHEPNSAAQEDGDMNTQQQQSNLVEDNAPVMDEVRNASNRVKLKVISWNVLADSYCNRSSHQNLPPKYQQVVFDRKKRQVMVQETLQNLTKRLQPDFWALQEVDPPLGIAKLMQNMGYGVVETDSYKDGRVGRVDSCGLYYNQKSWTCVEQETIHLDDLAILQSGSVDQPIESIQKIFKRSSSTSTHDNNKKNGKNSGGTYSNSLQGLQCSFVRKNVALLVRLEHVRSKRQVVVAVAHLFWNPAYEYVKLCQIHFVAQRLYSFCKAQEAVILCGDFNSQPGSSVHDYLTKGHINAKRVAPWYALSRQSSQLSDDKSDEGETREESTSKETKEEHRLADDLATSLKQISLSKTEDASGEVSIKYMLDFTLNKFCRWMRILGLDAALETEEEEQERTKNGNMIIFERCVREGRALVTTSTRVIQRKDCPPGSYLLDTKSLINLEETLVHLLLSHGVKLEPNQMLSRCVVCNGIIEEVFDDALKKKIFQNHQAPEEVHDDVLGVYQCNKCKQGYWWCEKPNSSASRVKNQATKLLELCIRGGVPVGDDFGMFGFVDVEKIKEEGAEAKDVSCHLAHSLDVVKWLQTENLTNPLQVMNSAYAGTDSVEESLPFTNVTSGFVGHLDYIMYKQGGTCMNVTDLLYVPRTYGELSDFDIPNGHLLPSCNWPSDHLAIGACFEVFNEVQIEKTTTTTDPVPPQASIMWPKPPPGSSFGDVFCGATAEPEIPETLVHGERCGCGCVPPIRSLFEMAELRKQARLKKLQQEALS